MADDLNCKNCDAMRRLRVFEKEREGLQPWVFAWSIIRFPGEFHMMIHRGHGDTELEIISSEEMEMSHDGHGEKVIIIKKRIE